MKTYRCSDVVWCGDVDWFGDDKGSKTGTQVIVSIIKFTKVSSLCPRIRPLLTQCLICIWSCQLIYCIVYCQDKEGLKNSEKESHQNFSSIGKTYLSKNVLSYYSKSNLH